MTSLLYCTPRALIIQYLEDTSHPELVYWNEKDKTFWIASVAMLFEWLKIARPDRFAAYPTDRPEMIRDEDSEEFLASVLSASFPCFRNGGPPRFAKLKIVTKSTEHRNIVNHFVGKKLYQWIIQLLAEQTHVDLIQWVDRERKTFQLLDITGLGNLYTKVQHILTKSPVYYLKMLMSSYCLMGILTRIDNKKYQYQFNQEWYAEEKMRKVGNIPVIDVQELKYKSLTEFPKLTRFEWNENTILRIYK